MLPGIWIAIVFASYLAALALELVGLKRRLVGRRAMLSGCLLLGMFAQGVDLTRHASIVQAMPLSSPAEWLYVAAWILAALRLVALAYLPAAPVGLMLMPVVIGLIVASRRATHEPFAPQRTFEVWGTLHGIALLLGTVVVCIGFAAGLMYLLQSYALKHSQPSSTSMRLPSLEWLERLNSRSLGLSTLFIALGFASGLVLSVISHRGESTHSLWSDPVVVSSAAMLAWLVAAEVFRLVYPAAREGRKVAYLTLASFVFLIITLASLTLFESGHGL